MFYSACCDTLFYSWIYNLFDHSIADKIKDQLQSQVDFYADKCSLVVMSELQNMKVAKLTSMQFYFYL